MLGTAPVSLIAAGTNSGPHDEPGCRTGAGVVVASATGGRADCGAQQGAHNGGADYGLAARIRPQRLLRIAPAVLVFGGEKIQGFARGWHNRHTGPLWSRYAADQTDQAGRRKRATPKGKGCIHCGAPGGVAGTVFQPPGHDAT